MSLNLRIIASASIVLLFFITLTSAAINRAYVESSETALRNQLTSQLYALMAAAEVDDNNVTLPSNELDTLLGLPSSGLYAYIVNQDRDILWQSSSTLNAAPPKPVTLVPGDSRLFTFSDANANYWIHAYGVNWAYDIDGKQKQRELTFNIITDLAVYHAELSSFRGTMWKWLLAMAIFLLVAQTIILRWGLSPLRKVSAELNRIEQGLQDQINDDYPEEIRHLSDNINQLIRQERDQKTRYRNALGDLAHSLKTPLAVIQNYLSRNQNATETENDMQGQLDRISGIVEYQLQRAATAGTRTPGHSVNLKNIVDRINESLVKVYRDKAIHVSNLINEQQTINIDEGDLMELLGNLIDNAYKWANSSIVISHHTVGDKHNITIEDDGPGITRDKIDSIMKRGVRADESTDGHGIGLSIVNSIVDAYHGSITISSSHSGGTKINITL